MEALYVAAFYLGCAVVGYLLGNLLSDLTQRRR